MSKIENPIQLTNIYRENKYAVKETKTKPKPWTDDCGKVNTQEKPMQPIPPDSMSASSAGKEPAVGK